MPSFTNRLRAALSAFIAPPPLSPAPRAQQLQPDCRGAVQSRAELERTALSFLGESEDLSALADRQIHERVLRHLVGRGECINAYLRSDADVRRWYERAVREARRSAATPTVPAFIFSSFDDVSETDPDRGFADDLGTQGGQFIGVENRT